MLSQIPAPLSSSSSLFHLASSFGLFFVFLPTPLLLSAPSRRCPGGARGSRTGWGGGHPDRTQPRSLQCEQRQMEAQPDPQQRPPSLSEITASQISRQMFTTLDNFLQTLPIKHRMREVPNVLFTFRGPGGVKKGHPPLPRTRRRNCG